MPLPNYNHLQTPLRHSQPSSSSSTSRLLLLLTFLPLTLAALAFVLQWRGGLTDPVTRWSPRGSYQFPGMDASPLSQISHRSSTPSGSGCLNLGRSASPSFPYYQDWKFDRGSDLKPKVYSSSSLELLFNWCSEVDLYVVLVILIDI